MVLDNAFHLLFILNFSHKSTTALKKSNKHDAILNVENKMAEMSELNFSSNFCRKLIFLSIFLQSLFYCPVF